MTANPRNPLNLAWAGLATALASSAAMWVSVFTFQTRVGPVRVFSIVTILACLVAVGLAFQAMLRLKSQRRWVAVGLAGAVVIVGGFGVYCAYIVTLFTFAK